MLQRTKQALAAVLPGTRSSTLFREESCGGHQKLLPLPGEAPALIFAFVSLYVKCKLLYVLYVFVPFAPTPHATWLGLMLPWSAAAFSLVSVQRRNVPGRCGLTLRFFLAG